VQHQILFSVTSRLIERLPVERVLDRRRSETPDCNFAKSISWEHARVCVCGNGKAALACGVVAEEGEGWRQWEIAQSEKQSWVMTPVPFHCSFCCRHRELTDGNCPPGSIRAARPHPFPTALFSTLAADLQADK